MSLRTWIASSPLARLAAMPPRAVMGARHVGKEATLTTRWLIESREHTNFTYDLEPLNVRHLAWWTSAVSGATFAECHDWIVEVTFDEGLMRHVRESTARSRRRGLADSQVRVGRRAGWYALVRALKPDHVVETGTDKGLGAVVIASALLRNGKGKLTSVDINPEAGYLVDGAYREVTELVTADSIAAIKQLPDGIDLFIHDSDHSAAHEARELIALEPKLRPDARILSDNAHVTESLMVWAAKSQRQFLYFQEVPRQHWYQGGGIGAAWVSSQPER